MTTSAIIVRDNLHRVRARIAAAAEAAGRSPEAVRLVGVTKYVDPATTRLLVDAGCLDLGESRPQDLWAKAGPLPACPLPVGEIEWHLIGHLQRNKVRRTLPLVGWIHSGDSTRLIEAIDAEAAAQKVCPKLLLEVNISGDATKHGYQPQELRRELRRLAALTNIEIRGLMAMASLAGGREAARRDFAAVRQLRDELRAECPEGVALDELSMGMSGDLEEAILEGATMVRVGSALFEGLAPR